MSEPRTQPTGTPSVADPSSLIAHPSSPCSHSAASTLPEFWKTPTADPPVQARPLGWLLVLPVLLGLMIVPRRVGPCISKTGWGKTVVVHAFCLLLTVVMGCLTPEEMANLGNFDLGG